LGGEIIRDPHEDSSLRRKNIEQILAGRIDDEGGPLVYAMEWEEDPASANPDSEPLTTVTSQHICDSVPSKESAMLNWLVRLWRKIDTLMHGRQGVPNTYHPSNLHGRHR
jgi:hypothetical protein